MLRRALLVSLLTVACTRAEGQTTPRTPVVVEMFTSEGCSSCPPADEELARLEKEQPVAGALVVPIAWHVDYWDYLGWKDPFSSPASTERQRGYARANGTSSLYTPQAMVDGAEDVSGSRSAALRRAIADAAKAPKANVALRVKDGALEVAIDAIPQHGASDVTLVLVQPRARVSVPRGENAGRTLEHTAIAREVRAIGEVKASDASARVRSPVTSGRGYAAVVVLEQRTPRKVLGAAMIPLM
jgi:hypothetical protein